jgi:integrase
VSRRRGTGSIFRKPGCTKWIIQFYQDGKRIREATGLTDRAEAQRRLTKRLYQVDRNEFAARERKPVRIEELFKDLEEHNRINRKGRARDLRVHWSHLSPPFGSVVANNLTTDAVRHYIAARQQEGAANATINRELASLKRMFNLGRQCTPPKIRVLPYIPMLKENNVRTGFVDNEAFSRLIAEASELWLRLFLELGFTYGWRRAELLGLKVRQLSWSSMTIRLDPGTTKNREGREVAMTAIVAELLKQAIAGKKPDDFVLTWPSGKRVKDFRDAWRRLCERAALGSFTCRACDNPVAGGGRCPICKSSDPVYQGLIVHDLRRSAAKAMRAAGVPESVIMAAGGWKTPAMFRRYAIVSSADQRAAVEMLERARAENSPHFGPHFKESTPQPTPVGDAKLQ